MNDHDAFLQAIFKHPEDVTVRLVYADWLDEHGNPGGELIRVRHQLSLSELTKTKRDALAARERKLVAKCDQDWLERHERADWKLRYLQMRPEATKPAQWTKLRQAYWTATAQKATSRAVADFEKELGKPLPRSWKSFVHGCGPGELGSYFRLYAPTKGDDSVVNEHRMWFQYHVEEGSGRADEGWLTKCICFGWTIGGEAIVWDTSKVTDPIRTEYEVAWLNRSDRKYRTFESLGDFWTAALEQQKGFDNPPHAPFWPY
jgi:uncharacterized protein (TIGR02996 family)